MTGIFILDWAIQAVSLFNVILLTWLGLTVLLNAERRTGGILLAGGGLLMGGAFFISHSAILGHDPNVFTPGQDFWWYLGWAPVICLPFAWYLVMLWYTGFWEARRAAGEPGSRLYHRQHFWFYLTLFTGILLIILLGFARILPSLTQIAQVRLASSLSAQGLPGLVLIYPVYALLCMSLSLDALLHPGPSRRWMGELARARAKPWLIAASGLLLLVSLLVGWAMLWIVINLEKGIFNSGMTAAIGVVDLIIAGLIGLSVVIIGQAVVSYEIFTARTLPRNGLFQHWRRALILAAGYSVLVSWSLAIHLRPIYSLLLTTLLMTVFFAMLAWRSYAERERFISNLRPFLTGAKFYTRILDSSSQNNGIDVSASFQVLCRDILETSKAWLLPLGEMAQLAGPAVLFPDGLQISIPPPNLTAGFHSPETSGLPLNPEEYDGFIWAIPLWSERGLAGTMLLGEKRTGGLFTQEEIETARAVGERLIDLKASAELARRLALLERHHLAQAQVVDQQPRRVLHDEVLPLVHTALINLTSDPGLASGEEVHLLTDIHRKISDLLRSMAATTSPEVARLGLLGALHQVIEQDLADSFDCVDWQVDGASEDQLKTIPVLEAEVIFYAAREALRNSARYGRAMKSTPLKLTIRAEAGEVIRLVIEDNGPGVNPDLKMGQTQYNTGSGQGLELHSTLLAVLGGSLSLESEPGKFTRVILSLPRRYFQALSSTSTNIIPR